jgi:hypothetical protein
VTIIIDQATRQSILSFTFDFRSTTAGVALIVLLVAVLTLRELIRVHGGPRMTERLDQLNVAAYPLMLAFTAIIVVRVVSLI